MKEQPDEFEKVYWVAHRDMDGSWSDWYEVDKDYYERVVNSTAGNFFSWDVTLRKKK